MQVWKSQSELKNINISKINDGDLTSQTLGLSESYFVVTGRMDGVRDWWSLGLVESSNSHEDHSFNQSTFNFRSHPSY